MKLRVLAAALALVFGFASSALSGVLPGGPPSFDLDVTSSIVDDARHVSPTLVSTGSGYTASGNVSTPSYSLSFAFTSLNPDPAVTGSFTLTNLSSATQTFSVSATLGVLPISGQTQLTGYFGDATYRDTNDGADGGDGSVGFGTPGSDPFYRAEIDGGVVHVLGSFTFVALASDPGVFGTLSKDSFGPIAGPAVGSKIGVSFPGFMLTAHDTLQVPFEFAVVPEPTLGGLFAASLALMILFRRCARKSFHEDEAAW